MIRLGLVSAILPELTLEQVLDTCAREGYQCVELMCWPRGAAERRYAGVTHVDVNNLDVDAVLEAAASRKIEISGLGYYPNPLAPDAAEAEAALKHLRRVIVGASKLSVPVVNTFIGRDWTKSLKDNWERFRGVWPDLVKFAEDQGVKVAIENCPMLFTNDEWPGGKNLAVSPAIWRRMFEEIPSASFGLNYDPSHMIWQQMDAIRPLREFRSRLFHVHAKDARVDRESLNDVGILATPLEYHSPRIPGLGDVDWPAFFAELGRCGYRGPVCVEVEDKTFEGSLEDRVLAARQSRAFLSQFCAHS
jgi:sugar phosphate isomerase/epimerase